tara:strand:+ start:350 stop:751 length:402 start_codon:yes stop_codon:yes gene_type:complete
MTHRNNIYSNNNDDSEESECEDYPYNHFDTKVVILNPNDNPKLPIIGSLECVPKESHLDVNSHNAFFCYEKSIRRKKNRKNRINVKNKRKLFNNSYNHEEVYDRKNKKSKFFTDKMNEGGNLNNDFYIDEFNK